MTATNNPTPAGRILALAVSPHRVSWVGGLSAIPVERAWHAQSLGAGLDVRRLAAAPAPSRKPGRTVGASRSLYWLMKPGRSGSARRLAGIGRQVLMVPNPGARITLFPETNDCDTTHPHRYRRSDNPGNRIGRTTCAADGQTLPMIAENLRRLREYNGP